MSHTPNFDAKINAILDAIQAGEQTCALTGEKWMLDELELNFYRKFSSPLSVYSPQTRMKLLGGFRTGFEIFWNKHAKSGEPILSYIHPDNPIPVVTDADWHAMDIGGLQEYQREIDPAQPFFEQFRSLAHVVPMGARREWKNVVNTVGVGMWDIEDSYLVFSTVGVKRCMYTFYCLEGSEDITQSVHINHSQNCFGSTQITRCHSCTVAVISFDCLKCDFVYDCRNCEFVFGGANLRNKKYVWFNEQLSKDEWERRRAAVDLSCRSVFKEYQQKFLQLVEQSATPEHFNVNAPDCTGDYLTDCVRCKDCYSSQRLTDCAYMHGSTGAEGSAFCVGAYPATQSWMCSMISNSSNLKYSMTCGRSQNLEYCFNCHDCENCFGCDGLRNRKFCIGNVQYSEDEYWRRVDALKCAMLERGEYGQFFPQDLSPTGMQFSHSAMYYRLSTADVQALGAPLYDPDQGVVLAPKKTVEEPPKDASAAPDCLRDVDPAVWVSKPFMDERVRRRWSVVPKEFAYYTDRQLPFPEEHYSSRLQKQIQMMNQPAFEQLPCVVCQKPVQVGRNPAFTKRRVHCMSCYLKYLEAH